MSWISNRFLKRLAAEGPLRSLSYLAFTVGLERIGIQYLHCFRLVTGGGATGEGTCDMTFAMLRTIDDLTAEDRQTIATYSGEHHLRQYEAAFARGEWCAVARCHGNELACECWLSKRPGCFLSTEGPNWLIERCWTVPSYRGKGLYPRTLRFACDELLSSNVAPENIFIECNAFNSASLRGIQKAGFVLAGKRLSVGRWNRQWKMCSGVR